MHPMLNTAIKAARRAGQVILRHVEQLDRLTIETKGHSDYVSQVDRQAEAEIIHILRTAYPQHGILAEESGSHAGDDYQWIIDPLDGTTNFLHGYLCFGVSIALKHRDKLDQAVVFDPVRNELFTASRGSGAQVNERRIRVSRTPALDAALIGTGFPFRSTEHLETWIDIFRSVAPVTSGVRRAGSASLDLAHVAAGRLDGFWEFGLKPWDMAAGVLLIQEAGGFVSDYCGGQDFLKQGHVVAGNPRIQEELLRLMRPHLPASICNPAA